MSYHKQITELAKRFGNNPAYISASYKYLGTWNYLDIFQACIYDIAALEEGLIPPLKKDCALYRYQTETTLAGNLFPAVMINEKRNLLYFCNHDARQWHTRGVKIGPFTTPDTIKDFFKGVK